jgi:hypothetical protein
MLNNYIKEFIAITEYLIKNGQKKTLKFIIISKAEIEPLLGKNKFDSSLNKLKIWKALNWIDAEDERVTRRIYDRKAGKYIPCIKIYLQVYETLKRLA